MNELKFHEEDYDKPDLIQKSIRADSFGLSTFLVKKGFARNIRSAKKLSNMIMLVTIIIALILMIVINTGNNDDSIDEKYYYDPTQT